MNQLNRYRILTLSVHLINVTDPVYYLKVKVLIVLIFIIRITYKFHKKYGFCCVTWLVVVGSDINYLTQY